MQKCGILQKKGVGKMAQYRTGSHTVYDIKYHFVWITKYRYKVLQGNIAVRLRELRGRAVRRKDLK